MVIRNLLIRLVADCIWFLRRKTIRTSKVRIIVFTGTSGKTLAREATSYALQKMGHSVSSPSYGYTNELGIVLAALGVHPRHLFSLAGMRQVLAARPPQETYVLVELGADWRSDIAWFLKRFTPYGVCITNVAREEWTRSLNSIWKDKTLLLDAVDPEGFICWSGNNESLSTIKSLVKSHGRAEKKEFTISQESYDSPLMQLLPYRESFGAAIACIQHIDAVSIERDFFNGYISNPERLTLTHLTQGGILLSDIYKAVPQCTEYVLRLALEILAERRVLVLSAMHPLWRNQEKHYESVATLASEFDRVFFVGPSSIVAVFAKGVKNFEHVDQNDDYKTLLEELKKENKKGTLIVIKTAGRYGFGKVVEELKKE